MSSDNVQNSGVGTYASRQAQPESTVEQSGRTSGEDQNSSGQSHKMSIALTIGATIGVIGLIILLYGLFGSPDISRSDGINIDLWWGLLMIVFGILMGTGGYITSRRRVTRSKQA